MRKIKLILEFFIYYLVKGLMFIINLLAKLSLSTSFFKEMTAGYSYGRGSRAYREKRYEDAYKILKPIADYDIKNGYVGNCQYVLGLLYYFGLGIDKNIDTAMKYLNDAKAVKNHEAIKFLNKIGKENQGVSTLDL